jgi:Sulfotransferase family
MSEQLKVFILGPPGVGTSLTYLAMREVFGLPGAGEGHVVTIFDQMLRLHEAHVAKFADLPVLASRLQLEPFQHLLHDYARHFYADAYPDGSFVDKSPGAPAAAQLILTLFPDARILLTRRTGIEFVSSHRARFEQACRLWTRAMADTVALRELPPELRQAVLELDQIDLTDDPEHAATRIAGHLGRPEQAAELARFFVDRPASQKSGHDSVKRLTLADSGWSDADRATFVRECGPMMDALGYPM